MNSFQKVMKSKTVAEAIKNIPLSFFNAMSFLIALYFMLQPFLRFVSVNRIPSRWRTTNYTFLFLGAVILAVYAAKCFFDRKKISIQSFFKNNPAITLFFFFAALMLLSTAVNGFSKLSLTGDYYRAEGLLGYLSYIVYFLLLCINKNEKQKKLWLYIFLGTSAVLEIYTVSEFALTGKYNYYFVFEQYNHYGYYLLMSMAVSAVLFVTSEKPLKKILFISSFMLGTAALLINDTFGCQLAAALGIIAMCVIYSIAKGKFKASALVPLAAMAVVFAVGGTASESLADKINSNLFQIQNDVTALKDGKDEAALSTGVSRIVLWENTMKYISEKPVLGHSADATAERLKIASNGDNGRCHCEYMNYAVSFGIPAALVYMSAVFMIYLRGLRYRKVLTETNLIGLCGAMFYLISAVIGNTMFYTAPFLFILLGMGYYQENLS